MEKNRKTLSTAFIIAALFLSFVAAVLYYNSLMSSFSTVYGHFSDDAATAFTVCVLLAVACGVASGAMLYKNSTVIPDKEDSISATVVFVIIGALLAAQAVLTLPDAFRALADSSASTKGTQKEEIIGLFTPLLEIPAAIYFIISTGGKKVKKARTYLSFTAILWALFATLSVYFDGTRTINSPIKAILLCVSVVNMLFITEDARFLIGAQKAPLFRAISTICLSFGIAFAIPDLLCALEAAFGKTSSSLFNSPDGIFEALNFDLFTSLIALAIAAAAGIRLLGSRAYLGEYSASKHEKSASDPFGEAPEENNAPEIADASEFAGLGEEADNDGKADDSENAKEAEEADGAEDAPESDESDEE